ncbi:MAG TPA: flavin reductase family protein [Dehalococcoidia bacterium]|nr:flavin reductase family protein [Dehalococcoidia bacterium]
MPLDPAVFRDALGHFPSGVCVVTTIDPQGRSWGFTASAFSSLSLEPPLILVCLDREADSHDAFYNAGGFAVSILASHQMVLATHFATRGIEKFDGVAIATGSELSLPLIPEAVVHLECRMHQTIPVGDHTILVGNVAGAVVNDGEPLVFHARRYGIMQPHPVA